MDRQDANALQCFQVPEPIDIIRLQDSLLVPLVPGGDEEEVSAHVLPPTHLHCLHRSLQVSPELRRAHCILTQFGGPTARPIVESCVAAPVLGLDGRG
jgi:hypothetical protein